MMFKRNLVNLTEPKWADVEHSVIHCMATFAEFGRPIPFIASERDTEDHGKDIFNRIVAGEFGPIGEYVPPQPRPTNTSKMKPGNGPVVIA